MKAYSLKTFLLHGAIVTIYFAVTSYLFVVGKDPNPIGAGLQQWLCVFLHVTITLFVMLTLLGKATDKKLATRKVVLHTVAIILAVSLYLLFSNPIWDWLWSLR
jgi:hypothetical protein